MTAFPPNRSLTDPPPTKPGALNGPVSVTSSAENCTRIRELGYTTHRHVNMYGERFELVSDPFEDGAYTAVHVLSGTDPIKRTVRLPVAILTGLKDHFRKA